jgi:predicted P-loop ATPase
MEDLEERPYIAEYMTDGSKAQKPLMNASNVMKCLRHDRLFSGHFGYDEMKREQVYKDKRVSNGDIIDFMIYMQDHCGLRTISKETIDDAVSALCNGNRFNRVQEYLLNLQWDGIKRLDHWISGCLGTPDSDYVRDISRKFLIMAVARVMEPGCKADYMLVLESAQGEGKSKVPRALFGSQYFSDHLGDPDNKDTSMLVASKWCIEVAELEAMNRVERNTFKHFLTRQEEEYRPPYGRRLERLPRQCVFIGTTNDLEWQKDDTGGRRFWPVRVGRTDIEFLTACRDDLWAEATHAYHRGEQWYPTREVEARLYQPEQEARRDFDEISNLIVEHLNVNHPMVKQTTVAEVISLALGVRDRVENKALQYRVATVLKDIGWTRKKTNTRVFWYR